MNPSPAQIVFEPMLPAAAIVATGLILGALAIQTYWQSGQRLGRWRRSILLIARLLAIGFLCGLLAQPMTEESIARRHPKRVALVAVDSSQSMRETDAAGQTVRLDAARQALAESGLAGPSDAPIGEVRLFQFDSDAADLSPAALPTLAADGETTRFHQSLGTVLKALRTGEHCVGLFVFTDGHDFELASAPRTAQMARAKQAPIFPIPLGRATTVPDVSLHIAGFQPFVFIKQKAQIHAAVRLMGTEARPLKVEIFREGRHLRDRTITVGSDAETAVVFDVSEENPGQYEYEVRVTALPGEREVGNNTAYTFLNVTDARVPVLLVEGEPHWDTTFLRRTLLRNERVRLVSLASAGSNAPRLTASPDPDAGEPKMPETAADFAAFPLIVFGKKIEAVLDASARSAIAAAVEETGATLVFARGQPGETPEFDDLAPAPWTDGATGPVRIAGGRGSAQIVPLELLATAPGGSDALPDLPAAFTLETPKTLSAVEATAEDTGSQSASPAFVHRRQGKGQVLAVAVGGLWKWSLNAKAEASNNIYDRFWNQLLLNLVARSSAAPSREARLTVNSANVTAGEKIGFTLRPGTDSLDPGADPRVVLYLNGIDQPAAGVPITREAEGGVWRGSYVPDKPGRYRGALLMGGRILECRFAVHNQQRETTEVSPDLPYLKKLAEISGGRVLDPAALKEAVDALSLAAVAESEAPPIIRRRSLWDRAKVFYALVLILGVEWFCRRRWGLT